MDECKALALGTPRYIDRAALVASVLLYHTPGTNITLFTDRALWAQWRAGAYTRPLFSST